MCNWILYCCMVHVNELRGEKMKKKILHELFGDTGYPSINRFKAIANALIIVLFGFIFYLLIFKIF